MTKKNCVSCACCCIGRSFGSKERVRKGFAWTVLVAASDDYLETLFVRVKKKLRTSNLSTFETKCSMNMVYVFPVIGTSNCFMTVRIFRAFL